MSTQIKSFVFGPFMENTSVVYDDTKQCVIIDPGCFEEEEERELQSFIEENGLKPVLLLLTHSHLDHVFGVPFVGKKWGLIPQVHPLDQPVYESFDFSCSRFGIKPKSELTKIVEKYSNLINEASGKVIKVEEWGLLNLATKIKNYNKGFYIHYKFEGNKNTLNEMNKKIKIDSSIIRHLVVKYKNLDIENEYFKKEK